MYQADLHVHTSVSDCSEGAETILKQAKELGLTHIAFTDHDTIEFAEAHVRLAADQGLMAVPAIEISAFDRLTGKKAHILGYGYERPEVLEAFCRPTLEKRDGNCRRQIEILAGLGYRMDEKAIEQIAGHAIYKQHILDYLVRTGQEQELFGDVYRKIFKNKGPCDFDIEYPEAEEAVRKVKEAGGFAVLAHPGQQKNFEIIKRLKDCGLDGLEYAHPSNDGEDRCQIRELGERFGLFLTGGSDYHGLYEQRPSVLGSQLAPEDSRQIFCKKGFSLN